MGAPTPRARVVVVSWNGAHLLPRALDSLETERRPLVESLGELRFRVERTLRAAGVRLVWQVADESQARQHFDGKLKLRLTEVGCISPGFAIDPDDFLGARHEFVTA